MGSELCILRGAGSAPSPTPPGHPSSASVQSHTPLRGVQWGSAFCCPRRPLHAPPASTYLSSPEEADLKVTAWPSRKSPLGRSPQGVLTRGQPLVRCGLPAWRTAKLTAAGKGPWEGLFKPGRATEAWRTQRRGQFTFQTRGLIVTLALILNRE